MTMVTEVAIVMSESRIASAIRMSSLAELNFINWMNYLRSRGVLIKWAKEEEEVQHHKYLPLGLGMNLLYLNEEMREPSHAHSSQMAQIEAMRIRERLPTGVEIRYYISEPVMNEWIREEEREPEHSDIFGSIQKRGSIY